MKWYWWLLIVIVALFVGYMIGKATASANSVVKTPIVGVGIGTPPPPVS